MSAYTPPCFNSPGLVLHLEHEWLATDLCTRSDDCLPVDGLLELLLASLRIDDLCSTTWLRLRGNFEVNGRGVVRSGVNHQHVRCKDCEYLLLRPAYSVLETEML